MVLEKGSSSFHYIEKKIFPSSFNEEKLGEGTHNTPQGEVNSNMSEAGFKLLSLFQRK